MKIGFKSQSKHTLGEAREVENFSHVKGQGL